MNAVDCSIQRTDDHTFICVSFDLFAVTAGVGGQDAHPTGERGEVSFRT